MSRLRRGIGMKMTEYVFVDPQGVEHYEMVECPSDFWAFYHMHDAKRGMSLDRYNKMKESNK